MSSDTTKREAILGTIASVRVEHFSNAQQVIRMPAYQITGGVMRVTLVDVNGDTYHISTTQPVDVEYDDGVYTVKTEHGTVCTEKFTYHIIPATSQVLCVYVGRVNFQIGKAEGDERNFSDLRAALADARVAKLLLLNAMQGFIYPNSTPKPGFTEQWVEETYKAYEDNEYWFQMRPAYEDVMASVDTTLSPHERFLRIKDQLADDHFLPDVMPQSM